MQPEQNLDAHHTPDINRREEIDPYKLLQLPTSALLEKFGAGNHKPGSGSAVALQGMLSAKLILTVIELTCDEERRPNFDQHFVKLQEMKSGIEKRIFPELVKLFQDDSYHFGKVVPLRRLRNLEKKGSPKYIELDIQSREALRRPTEIPVEIARLCVELGTYATFVFDYGFKAVRGDSNAALNSAAASIAGALAIVELNLQKFEVEKWSKSIRSKVRQLKLEYENLMIDAARTQEVLEAVNRKKWFDAETEELRIERKSNEHLSNAEIEELANNAVNVLWDYRMEFWSKEAVPESQLRILDPKVVLEKILRYKLQFRESLGQFHSDNGRIYETAGIIDKQKKTIGVSKSLSREVQNFTLAHELGHAILHDDAVLHRDMPLDGSISYSKDFRERQANKFAT
jgi:formiminotetrahydrofolate cyclodeaminase